MLTFYIIASVIGGGLVLVSLLFGHHDADVSGHAELDAHVDASIEVHHDHEIGHGHAEHEAHIWLPFLSLRFWTYFFGTFGLCGLLLTKFTDVPEPIVGWMSAGAGILTGFSVALLMRLARRFEADSSVRTKDLLGSTAHVLVTVRPGQEGKIRCNIKGDIIEFLALPQDDEVLEPGAEVVIVAVENDRAKVMPVAALLS